MGWDWGRIAGLLCGPPTSREHSTWLQDWALVYECPGMRFAVSEHGLHVQYRRPDGREDGLHVEGSATGESYPPSFLLRMLAEGLAQISGQPGYYQ